MLVLERTLNESIIIINEDEIKITVLEVVGKHVRLGISAPRKIAVHREEVYERIKQSKPHK